MLYKRNRTLTDLTPNLRAKALSSQRDQELSAIASDLGRQCGIEAELEELRYHMLDGEQPGEWAWLQADDYSGIYGVENVVGVVGYTSRAFTRAHDGDWVAAVLDPINGYEEYMAQCLRLGRPRFLQVKACEAALPYAVFTPLLEDETSRKVLVQDIKSKGGLIIHPYMGIAAVWRLAQLLTKESGQAVKVIAPLPGVTSFANNKISFLEMARQVLGQEMVVESTTASTLDEMVQLAKRFAGKANEIVLRRPDSATGLATKVWRSQELNALGSDEAVRSELAGWLKEIDWQDSGSPPIEVAIWEDSLASPSIQMWIPPVSNGWPLCEGIFDQRFVAGSQVKVFEGSLPSQLPQKVQARLRDYGLQLSRVLQLMGYVGRCSFDTILCGPSLEQAQIKLVECNGRWGGTSTPMTFMNRLFGDYRKQPYVASDHVNERLKGVSFAKFIGKLDDVLLNRHTGQGWLVVYNVGPLTTDGKMDALTIGKTQDEANIRQEEFRGIVEERF